MPVNAGRRDQTGSPRIAWESLGTQSRLFIFYFSFFIDCSLTWKACRSFPGWFTSLISPTGAVAVGLGSMRKSLCNVRPLQWQCKVANQFWCMTTLLEGFSLCSDFCWWCISCLSWSLYFIILQSLYGLFAVSCAYAYHIKWINLGRLWNTLQQRFHALGWVCINSQTCW